MAKLTKEKAINEVEHIRNISGDDESAHSREDYLYDWFIYCITKGLYTKAESIEIAKIIRQTKDIDFARWCA